MNLRIDARRYQDALWLGRPDAYPLMHPCNCVGPQNGDPVCPCRMRSVSIRNGRYVRVTDLGPAPPADDSNSD